MDSAIERLEKQVGEAVREIAVLKERVGDLEQIFSSVKDFMEEIKEALALGDEKGKSPLVRSLNKPSPVQMANALGSGRGRVKMGRNRNASVSVKNSTVAIDVAGAATFKFRGKIGTKEVIVKIGSGASHNFISKEVVAELQLPVERTRSFQVNFGFGHKAKGAEVCNNVVVEAQGMEFVARFFPTHLRLADVMLGMEWFRSVGTISLQGSPQTMTFNWHGRTVTLESDTSLTEGPEFGLMTLEWDEED